MNAADLLMSAAMGLLAWSLVCFAFIGLLDLLGIILPLHMFFSLYPLAMLAGAASMVPGRIGTTEAAIIFLFGSAGISLEQAALAALGIRVATFKPVIAQVKGLPRLASLALSAGDFIGIGVPNGISREALLAGFQEVFAPAIIKIGIDAFAAA